jgi:hypothetical protein
MWSKDGYTKCASDDIKIRLRDFEMKVVEVMRLGDAHQVAGEPLMIFLAPEYYFRKDRKRSEAAGVVSAYTAAEFKSVCEGLKTLSKTVKNFLVVGGSVFYVSDEKKLTVRHSVPIYYNGDQITPLYDKRNDCVELAKYEVDLGYTWKPGDAKGTFKINTKNTAGQKVTLNCGIETCVDQDKGELQKTQKDLDLDIIVSNTVSFTKPAAKATGYVLHCNASQTGVGPGNFVYKTPFKATDKVAATKTNDKELLGFWNLDLG